jgi:hypothetical protein
MLSVITTSQSELPKEKFLTDKSSVEGIKYFYDNYDKFLIYLGSDYGSHRIRAVEIGNGSMTVKYDYKGGTLEGQVTSNGGYYGDYQTTSTNGSFDLKFNSDGTAAGQWKSSGFLQFSGVLKIMRK